MALSAGLIALFTSVAVAQEPYGREDVVGLAPDDVGVEEIGRLFTREFRPLVGATNNVLSDPANVRIRQQGTTSRELPEVTTQAEVSVDACAMHTEVSGSYDSAKRHPYIGRRRMNSSATATILGVFA